MDDERNSMGGRISRYARVGAGMGGVAVRAAGGKVLGRSDARNAEDLKRALGSLKGPIMKIAQLMATIPNALPEEYAAELSQLQSNAPAMGWSFIKRRMQAELGPNWQSKFESFGHEASAAASLGQVHRAEDGAGRALACKLQYPDMQSAVEADLKQLQLILRIYKSVDGVIDPSDMGDEIGARLREELDYDLEARHMALYRDMLKECPDIVVPETIDELSTPRLLTMNWLEGKPLLDYREAPLETRNAIAQSMFRAWWGPFSQFGAIHGDPHLGNYSIWEEEGETGINLLDFGCIRTFNPSFVEGVNELYHALESDDQARSVHAYEIWGFKGLTNEMIEVLNIWAGFIYAPMLDNRVRTIADGTSPGDYGRKEAFQVHSKLRELGPVAPPREFVFMDRAAIGLGAVFLHLDAELNFYELFNQAIADFSLKEVVKRQKQAFNRAGVPLPA